MERGYPDDWDRRRRRVYKRDNWQCQSCGRMGNRGGDAQLHAHHILERSNGGSDTLGNLITLCDRCHAQYHENPHLLEDGPPVSPSMFTKVVDWFLIDVLSVKVEEERAVSREEPEESSHRKALREEGLDALTRLAAKRTELEDAADRSTESNDGTPPRLYETGTGGFLTGSTDSAVNSCFHGCPNCGHSELSADWVKWEHRGMAKRICCSSCNALFEERIVERNGRSLVDLEPVASVFEIGIVESPTRYQLSRPSVSLSEFERQYGTNCLACDSSQSLHYEWVWRRSDLIPRYNWVCQACGVAYVEGNDRFVRIDEEAKDEDEVSELWYYSVVVTVLLSPIALLANPYLLIASGTIVAPAIYKDIEYVRTHSEQNPSTPVWTWGALVLSAFAGFAYLANRKRLDSPDSSLHSHRLRQSAMEWASEGD